MAFLERLAALLRGGAHRGGARELNGFVDALLQKFEDSRPGLPDGAVQAGAAGGAERAERYFLDLYEKEVERLLETIRVQSPHLSPEATKRFLAEVDDHVRRVVVPGYVRLARRFTARERNDFFVLPDAAHTVERVVLALLGLGLGVLAIKAPFIPLWSREWMVPFALGGFVFPELRRVLAFRRYASDLDALVARADREIARLDVAYLTSRRERERAAVADAELATEDGPVQGDGDGEAGHGGPAAGGAADGTPAGRPAAASSRQKGRA